MSILNGHNHNAIVIAREPLASALTELQTALPAYYAEVERQDVPLCVDWAKYDALQEAGAFRLYTARHGIGPAVPGVLVGFASYFIQPSLHHSPLKWAVGDTFYVVPEYRKHGVGQALSAFIEADLTEAGVNFMQTAEKVGHREMGALLLARGYRPTEILWTKRLRDNEGLR